MFDTSGCVEHMYNRHTKEGEHISVLKVHLVCRVMTLEYVSLTRFGECAVTRIHCLKRVSVMSDSTTYTNTILKLSCVDGCAKHCKGLRSAAARHPSGAWFA
jgi:hypothetical protein